MNYKCTNCGEVFDENAANTQTERLCSLPDGGYFETRMSCPDCGSTSLVELETCKSCGNPFDADELAYGLCPDCIGKQITYDNALEFLNGYGIFDNFMLHDFFESPELDDTKVSCELHMALEELYRRQKANDVLLGQTNLLDSLKKYITKDILLAMDFVDYLESGVI